MSVSAFAQGGLFTDKLYPVFRTAQCALCHQDNGVASGSRLRFPPADADAARIRQFGLELRALVDAANPSKSPLLLKPTKRIAHTGGERIKQGSDEEAVLRAWVEHLAKLPETAAASKGPATRAPQTLRRLTHPQYDNTVRDLLGDDSHPAARFPGEDFVHGFTNQAEGQAISPLLAEAYNRAAERIARDAFRGGDTRGLLPCKQSEPDCGLKFIREFGRRAFRRPLRDAEAERYSRLLGAAAKRDGFLAGAQLVVEAMLQSPHFLFHLEPGAYGTASRLSYFLWNTMPDRALMEAAEAGRLRAPEQIRAQAVRMLQDQRARLAMDQFLDQWLRFDRLRNAIKDLRRFPDYSAELAGAMQEETRRLFQHLVWEGIDFREFFRADYTFPSPSLAKLYGLEPPSETNGRVPLPSGTGRAGVLGHASFLTLTSKPADTSPTERGLFVRQHFLCQDVPPPPPGVDTTLPALTDDRPLTVKQRLAIHLSNEACSGCHKLVDSIGFGLERYDAIGRFREKEIITIYPTADEIKRKSKIKPTEYTLDIETAGMIQGLPGAAFSSPRELGRLLAENPGCQRCVVKQLFRYALGRPETEADQPAIDAALDRFRASQFRFQELIIAVVTSGPCLGGPE